MDQPRGRIAHSLGSWAGCINLYLRSWLTDNFFGDYPLDSDNRLRDFIIGSKEIPRVSIFQGLKICLSYFQSKCSGRILRMRPFFTSTIELLASPLLEAIKLSPFIKDFSPSSFPAFGFDIKVFSVHRTKLPSFKTLCPSNSTTALLIKQSRCTELTFFPPISSFLPRPIWTVPILAQSLLVPRITRGRIWLVPMPSSAMFSRVGICFKCFA